VEQQAYQLISGTDGATIACVTAATSWLTKGIGVIGMRDLPAGQGLWLPGVTAIHTWFVAFPLDLLFLDANGRSVKVALAVKPWTSLVWAPGASDVIELGVGTIPSQSDLKELNKKWVLRPFGE
jgi:uncharacterized membrane protein (UPF0127 family)